LLLLQLLLSELEAHILYSNGLRGTAGGATWAAPGMVTGYLQQTGNFALMEDGTIVLAFGHKDDTYDETTKKWVMFGQRAIISHE
jgi:hypothetical protein